MGLQLEGAVGKSSQRGLEHPPRGSTANLGRSDDFPFAISPLELGQHGDVARADPFVRAWIAEAKRIEFDWRHGSAV